MSESSRKGRKIARRACDLCRDRRVQCAFDNDASVSCRRCIASGVACTFLTDRKPRGPPNRRVAEARQRALQNATSPTELPALPFTPVSIRHLVPEASFFAILDDYYARVYPLIPHVHIPTFKTRVASRDFDADPAFMRLCICICAATAASIPRRFASYETIWYSEVGELVDRVSHLVLVSRLTSTPRWQMNATCESILESITLSIACFYVNKPTPGWAYMSEAANFFRDLRLYKKESYSRYSLIQQELMKRAFWTAFIAQTHDRLSNVVPHTGLSYDPMETEWEFLVPLELTDEELASPHPPRAENGRPLPTIAGFNAMIKVIVCIVDLIDEAFTGSPTPYSMSARALAPRLVPELGSAQPLQKTHPELPLLDSLFRLMSQMEQILNHLPDELKPIRPAEPVDNFPSPPNDNEPTSHYDIMRVNIHITSIYVQSVILETCLDKLRTLRRKGEVSSDAWSGSSPATPTCTSPREASISFDLWRMRESVARELLHVVSNSSMWVMESNGLSMIVKIRGIAATLLEGEEVCDSIRASEAEKRSREYVARFVDILANLDYTPKNHFSATINPLCQQKEH